MSTALLLVVPVLFLAYATYRVIRRGAELQRLVRDGVEVVGVVVNKVKFNTSGPRQYLLRYQYRDQTGREHSNRSHVPSSVWEGYVEGGPIAVVYSASKPQISAPQYVVEQCRTALADKKARLQ